MSIISRLESYTLKYPQEVLLVQAVVDDQSDQVVVFKGFSSSLVRPTAFDPEVPTLPSHAVITQIDRLEGPYQPASPHYIERGLSLDTFNSRLLAMGL